MITLQNVSKVYGKNNLALDDVTVDFENGRIYGLLGRNGAGKTTIINLITNRIFATQGDVLIDGKRVRENDSVQGKIFCMTEKGTYPNEMKVKDAFKWAKGFYSCFDTEYALALSKKFSLDINKTIGSLSTGYRSITMVVLTLASCADIMIFDEPVLGLDANYREVFYKELIIYYAKKQNTIIISTHLIGEIADILEKVVIVDGGKIMFNGTVDEIKQSAYIVSGETDKVANYTEGKKILHSEKLGNWSAVTIYGNVSADDSRIIKNLGLNISASKLQDVFIKLTNKEGN